MKGTLDSEFLDEVSIYLNNGTINTQEYKAALKDIHTQHVRQYIRSWEPSKVLNVPTPAVSLLESNLDRRARTTLSQLRAGYSPHLNSYMHRLQPTVHNDSWQHPDDTATTLWRHHDDTMRICFPSQCVITVLSRCLHSVVRVSSWLHSRNL